MYNICPCYTTETVAIFFSLIGEASQARPPGHLWLVSGYAQYDGPLAPSGSQRTICKHSNVKVTSSHSPKQKLGCAREQKIDLYRLTCFGSNTGWAKKSKPHNFCNNFVYCHPIFIIFGTHTLQEICNRRMYSQPT